ncbi:MAG: DUF4432 family protein [Armatimonadota bacterium]|nr:DUF4432 family protein [Armatimonadota bacterium]
MHLPIYKCLISHGEASGWNTLTLENDLIRVTLLPEKGSDFIEFLYKPANVDYLWKSPIGLPAKPDSIPLPHDVFMDYYEGGWEEILPSGGLPNTYAGIDYGLHGELWSLPWSVRIDENRPANQISIVLNCNLTKLPLSIEKRLTLNIGEAILHIDETLTNESDEPVDFMWGHHPALGAPFLNGDCVLDVPAADCEAASIEGDPAARLQKGALHKWPMVTAKDGNSIDLSAVPPPSAKCSDEFWLTGLKEGWCAVTDTRRKLGFGMVWDINIFRSLWIWQEFGGTKEEPWNGESYVMGVEPWSSYALEGLNEAVRRNTHLTIQPHERLDTWVKAIAYEGIQRVQSIDVSGYVHPNV